MIWDRIADLVLRRPGRTLVLSLVPVLLPVLALPWMSASHDTLSMLPADAESVEGFHALSEYLPAGETAPLVVVIDAQESVYEDESLRALGDLSRNLRRLPAVASVRSAAMPTDGRRPDQVDEAVAQEVKELEGGLREAARGAGELADGIRQVRVALAEMDRRLPSADEFENPAAGLREAAAGAGELAAGLGEARDGVGQLRAGVAELDAGLAETRAGVRELRAEVAVPAEEALEDALDALEGFTVGRADPQYPAALEAVGEAYARVTGEHPVTGEQVEDDYEGLEDALAELSAGLAEGGRGLDRLDRGLGELDAGLAEAEGGARRLRDRLAAGAGEAEAEVDRLERGLRELDAGVSELRAGVRGELEPGARELETGLAEGAAEAADTDVEALVFDDGPFVVSPTMLDEEPGLREDLAFFVNEDERRTRLFVGLSASPFSDEAIGTAAETRRVARTSLLDSPLERAELYLTGPPALLEEVDEAVQRDFPLIVGAVLLGVFVVLVVLLRSLVAPTFMVASVLLSYGAALGTTTAVVQGLLDQPGLQWWMPPLLFVLLVALGVDYNIFLMGRVREEAHRRLTRHAVAEGVRHTGRVITSAGLILAGTFAILIAAPLSSLAQLGFAAAVGIIVDTFVIRALLVPSLAVLLGRWNWWPSSRAAAH